jgi:hypothetical protein
MALASQNHETSADQRHEQWSKLVRKLRWIGLEDEAERIQRAVRNLPPHERGTVSVGPFGAE